MRNCFRNCNLNIIHDVLCDGRISFIIRWCFFDPNPKYIFGCTSTCFGNFFGFVCLYYIFHEFFCVSGWTSGVFPLSLFKCFGIARNLFIIFSTYSSSECVLYLSCDLFCDEPASFCIKFLSQFRPLSFQSSLGYFHQKSNRVIMCWNGFPILLLRCLSLYAFIPIRKLIVWSNATNDC